MKWIDGTDLLQWADRRDSQALLPEVIRQLVYATVPDARRVEFRTGEGVQLPGWDGYVEAPTGTAYVPEGISCWELGAGHGITAKANDDYEGRTANPLGVAMNDATFVFVTPRRWAGKAAWVQAKLGEGVWREVRAHDADDLEPWIEHAPGVGAWLARKIDKYPPNVTSIDAVWNEFASTTNPPMTPGIVLAGRAPAQERVAAWLREPPSVLHLKADTTAEAIAFVAAHVMALPAEEQDRLRARALATSNAETLRALSMTRAPLLVLYDGENTAPASVAVQRGHHVLIPLPPGTATSGQDVGLPRGSRESFAAALKSLGLREEEAFVLARETGRSITAFQRRFAVARLAGPAWAQPPHVHDVIAMLFAGSWDDQRPGDRDLLAELTGQPYDDVARLATTWTQGADPPLRQAGSIYAFAAVCDAWQQVGPYLTREALARFATIAERVLSLDDPRLTLAPNERWLSAIRGQQQAHSAALREGIARSLVLLSLLGMDGILPHRSQDTASAVVSRVLAPGVPWQRWYSVAGVLTLLAEAAPQAFLGGLQAQLAPAAPELMRLFDEEGGGISSSSMHNHLLWALEVLAWDPTYLSAVILVLGRLARIDPGGRLQNRPINSLREIFLFWHPYTSATLAQRKQALELLVAREPDVAWDLLSKLLPKTFDHGMPTAQPQWRIVAARPPMTYGERDQGVIHILENALTLAGMNATRLALLVHDCGTWPPFLRDRLAAQLQTFAQTVAVPEERAMVWAALRQLVNNHRAYPTADWAVPVDALAPLAAVRDLLIPADLTTRYAWLFDDWWPNLGEPRGDDHAAMDAAVTQARQDSLREILQANGHEGLLALSQAVKYPGFVGRDTGDIIGGAPEQRALLVATLGSTIPSVRFFGQALVTRWQERHGEQWVDTMLAAPLTDDPDTTAVFLLGLPFGRSTWDRVAGAGAAVGDGYWREVQVWLPQGVTVDDLTFAVDCLVQHDRAFIALHLLDLHIELAPGALLLRILDAVRDTLIAGEALPPTQRFGLDLEQVLSRLDAVGVDASDIARLEWFFLPLLGHGRLTPTLTLHRQMSRDPALFSEVICAVYRAHNWNADEEPPPTEQEAARARVAYELLSSWHILPGTAPDGSVDAATLNAWVDDARARCTASDREASGDQYIGQILAHAPSGAEGLWPHPAVRDVIERLASARVESGIISGIFHSRGVFAKALDDGGNQERAIAARYQGYADALALPHPRTAGMLRQIAEDYKRYAQREDERAQQRDLD
jgi:hypothetical protein